MMTLADLVAVKVPQKKDGLSYLPALLNQRTKKQHKYIVFNSKLGPALVKRDGWKLRYSKKAKVFQLYYLPNDYTEEKDLATKFPKKVKKLKKKLLIACDGDINVKEPRLPRIQLAVE